MKKFLPIILPALMSMMVATQALAQAPLWQKTWDETLAAAKKEGKVVVVGSPDPAMRRTPSDVRVARGNSWDDGGFTRWRGGGQYYDPRQGSQSYYQRRQGWWR